MPRPLSNDLRERIVRTVEGGLSRNATAQKYDVSVSAVVKLLQQWNATGSCAPKRMGGYRKRMLAGHADRIGRLVAAVPDMTVAEMQKQLEVARIRVSQSTITRFLIYLGHSYKKNGSRRRAGTRGRQGSADRMAKQSTRS
jgi:putative transposase